MTIELCLSIIGAVTGIVGSGIGIIGILHNRFLAIHQFMETLESPDFIKSRAYIYNTNPDEIPVESEEASQVVNFFHHWGLLAKKHYLPLWVFDSGSGAGAIRLYDRTQIWIDKRQTKNNDKTYASNFKWLYYKLLHRKKKRSGNHIEVE